MDSISDSDRTIIREIIIGNFELHDNKPFTRDEINHTVMIDRDMPQVNSKLGHVIAEFDALLRIGTIVVVSGSEHPQKFRLR